MGCCVEDSVRVSKMAMELKSGPMLWHKRRFFGSNWRDVHSVLYNDSSLLWYRDRSLEEQEGGVVLKEAPELIAFGPYTSAVPDRPPLPDTYEQKQLLAFGVRGKDLVYWFLCPNEAEVASWMAAITSAMPPPPGPPPQQQIPQPPTAPDGQQQIPPAQYMPPSQPPPQYTPPQLQPQTMPTYAPQPSPAIPGQYPRMNYRPPPYGYNTVHPQPYAPQPSAYPQPNAGGGTTVVVQQDRQGGYVGGGGGDFAMGMLMGGAIGTAWGASHSHGWGHGPGWGGGGYSAGPQVHDTDITINNYYDNDTSIVNNNLDMTNNIEIEQEAPGGGDVIMGDMVAIDDGVGMFDGGDFDADFGGGDFGGDF